MRFDGLQDTDERGPQQYASEVGLTRSRGGSELSNTLRCACIAQIRGQQEQFRFVWTYTPFRQASGQPAPVDMRRTAKMYAIWAGFNASTGVVKANTCCDCTADAGRDSVQEPQESPPFIGPFQEFRRRRRTGQLHFPLEAQEPPRANRPRYRPSRCCSPLMSSSPASASTRRRIASDIHMPVLSS